MAIHVVYTRPMQIVDGQVINKNDGTINQIMRADMEIRIIEDSNVPNSSNNPSIVDYLTAEDASGLKVVHMDNTMIVTQS